MINKHLPLNRDYNREPNIKALKERGYHYYRVGGPPKLKVECCRVLADFGFSVCGGEEVA